MVYYERVDARYSDRFNDYTPTRFITKEEYKKRRYLPYEYIVEMICDWWSFSWKTENLYEIFDWYDQHKERMILADNTKKLVERFLEEIKMELDKDENGENKPM